MTNRFTAHSPAIRSSGGPLHGPLHIWTIILAQLTPFPTSAKLLTAIPGAGGLLAIWRSARVAATDRTDLPAPNIDTMPTSEDRTGAAIVVNGIAVRHSAGTLIGPLTLTVPRGSITGAISDGSGLCLPPLVAPLALLTVMPVGTSNLVATRNVVE